MSVLTVAEVFAGPALPAGVTIASVAVTVLDSSGASQTSTLNGSETPTPWSVNFTTVAGDTGGTVSSIATDSAGTVYPAVVQTYTTSGTGSTALQLSGTTVTIVSK